MSTSKHIEPHKHELQCDKPKEKDNYVTKGICASNKKYTPRWKDIIYTEMERHAESLTSHLMIPKLGREQE